jgi:hypothetical protein
MSQGGQYTTTFTASTAGGVVSFTFNDSTGITLNANYVRIENTGSSDGFYVRLGSTTATTSDWKIVAGSSAAWEVYAERGHYWDKIAYTTTAAAAPGGRVIALR